MTQPLIGNLSRGLVFVVSAPAGCGKTTLVRMLTREFACIKASVSCTTRAPRVGEVQGREYFFLSEEEFRQREAKGEFWESAEVFGYRYGTLVHHVERQLSLGNHVFLVIDTQGASRLRALGVQGVYLFIVPPSFEILEQRLKSRATEGIEEQTLRLARAQQEMREADKYDYVIVNDDLDIAYEVLKSIVIAVERKTNH